MSFRSAISMFAGKPFIVMGIVNVTPDSFYDGGVHESLENAYRHACRLRDEGADIIDIGGASSRSGAPVVSPEVELQRILPLLKRFVKGFNGPVSIDTTWSTVAEAAIDEGALWINDISAGRYDEKMAGLIADRGVSVVLMHSRGTSATMQTLTDYKYGVIEIRDELVRDVQKFLDAGVKPEQIILDPGVGFAKTADQNVELLRSLSEFKKLGYPLLVGTSRKSFIGKITGRETVDRLHGTLASVASAYLRGAQIFRVHDVKETIDFLKVFSEIEKELPAGSFK